MENKNEIPKKKKLKKIILYFFWFIFGIFLLAILTPVFLNLFFSKDIEPIDDSNILSGLSEINLLEEDNAYFDLIKIKDVINLESIPDKGIFINNYLNLSEYDDFDIEKILAENELALEYFNDASFKNSFQDPRYANPSEIDDDSMIALNTFREVTRLSALRSIEFAKKGDKEEAILEAKKIIKVGDLIERSQSHLFVYLVGVYVKEIGFNVLEKLILEYEIDSEVLDKYKNEFLEYNYSDNDTIWRLAYVWDKMKIVDILEGKYDEAFNNDSFFRGFRYLNKPPFKTNYYFKPNKLIKELNERYSLVIDYSSNPCELNNYDSLNFIFYPDNFVAIFLQDNSYLKMAVNPFLPPGILKKKCEREGRYLEIMELFDESLN
ncbi:hypothetical protein GW758_01160 [Candidatus Falkowbacteria bacterium]|nr:hypothetical protein [Candidatus Falkowbacteria bacterium]NCT54550.1 hypothetical protein [Candidatus Falkowbacteria bacterium]